MVEIIEILISFLTLSILEIVLGIDNLVFLSILSQKLPKNQQKRARQIGLTLAWIMRLLLLASAVWLTKLTQTVFTVFEMPFSWRDLFLLIGGIFLIVKATQEIHTAIEPIEAHDGKKIIYPKFSTIIIQIGLLDIVFSLDSVLTAIGLTERFWLMTTAISLAILIMIFASEILSAFIERHPTIKMLALSFLLLIGTMLIADGFKFHIPRSYIYVAMGFALMVEVLNLLYKKSFHKNH